MSISLTEICTAIDTTLSAATGLTYTQTFSGLSEGMQNLPVLQIYPESLRQDATTGSDRTTFKAGVRQTEIIVNCDLYARQRRDLGEDMAALIPLIDAIQDVLEQQDTKPYFGLVGIKSFAWSAQRVTFTYGEPQIYYVGARFSLVMRVF